MAITAKASIHDVRMALPTVDALLVGKRRRRPKRLRADKGYDSYAFRKALRRRRIKPAINHRDYGKRHRPPAHWDDRAEIRYSRPRWKVEQRIACLDQNRRLNFLYERTRTTYDAFLDLARLRCYLKRLSRCRG